MWIKRRNINLNIGLEDNKIKHNINLEKNSEKIFFTLNDNKISPWHDIPYKLNNDIYIMINEIPKWTRKKMEINVKKEYNPIIQDISDNKPREYVWGDMMFNYGAIPQTWEDPNHIYSSTQKPGDGDPIASEICGLTTIAFWCNKINKYGVLRVRKSKNNGIWRFWSVD